MKTEDGALVVQQQWSALEAGMGALCKLHCSSECIPDGALMFLQLEAKRKLSPAAHGSGGRVTEYKL